jgi:FMN phosphatase YigB (HAD superfamily)
MLKAVLIDLDNTMVLFDEPAFYGRYFERLSPRFEDLWPPGDFQQRLVTAIGALRHNDGRRSNRDFFLDAFIKGTGHTAEAIWERLIDFYRDDYHRISVEATAVPGLHRVLAGLRRLKLPLVVATNPIFPKMVQEQRLAWIGLAGSDFDGITHIENSAYVKPRTGYYRQICETIGVPPEQCMMVGNDAVNDMAAGRIGIRTYLTTDVAQIDYGSLSMSDRQTGSAPPKGPVPDATGPFADVPDAVSRWMTAS